MSKTQRITLTLPLDVLAQAREASQGNLSQFIGDVLREHLEYKRLEQLRDALIAGATANVEDDRVIAEEFRYADYEVTMKYVPPSPELEQEHAGEFSSTR
jgi:metal-responsive CopG/Arc/MetJ family transcriptional regulator